MCSKLSHFLFRRIFGTIPRGSLKLTEIFLASGTSKRVESIFIISSNVISNLAWCSCISFNFFEFCANCIKISFKLIGESQKSPVLESNWLITIFSKFGNMDAMCKADLSGWINCNSCNWVICWRFNNVSLSRGWIFRPHVMFSNVSNQQCYRKSVYRYLTIEMIFHYSSSLCPYHDNRPEFEAASFLVALVTSIGWAAPNIRSFLIEHFVQ